MAPTGVPPLLIVYTAVAAASASQLFPREHARNGARGLGPLTCMAEEVFWHFKCIHVAMAGVPHGVVDDLATSYLSIISQRHSVTLETNVGSGGTSGAYLIFGDSFSAIDSYLHSSPVPTVPINKKRNGVLIVVATSGESLAVEEFSRWLWFQHRLLYAVVVTVDTRNGQWNVNDTAVVFDPSSMVPDFDNDSGQIIYLKCGGQWRRLRKNMVTRKHNFYGRRLPITIFKRDPTAMPVTDPETGEVVRYTGLDGYVLQCLSQYLNFIPDFREPEDEEEFGFVRQNESAGMLGDLVNKRSAFAFNSLFYKDYNTDAIDFTHAIDSDAVCVLVPAAEMPATFVVAIVLDSAVKLCIAATYAVLCCVWHARSRLLPLPAAPAHSRSLADTCLEHVRLLVCSPLARTPRAATQRLLLVVGLVFYVTLSEIVQGAMVMELSNPNAAKEIDTLQELYERGYEITISSPNLEDVFGRPEEAAADSLERRLMARIRVVEPAEGEGAEQRVAQGRDAAALVRLSNVRLGRLDRWAGRIHLLAQCPASYLLAYAAPYDSPLLPAVNSFLARALECGLVDRWRQLDLDWKKGSAILRQASARQHQQRDFSAFCAADLSPYFRAYLGMLAASVAAFLVELLLHHRRRRRLGPPAAHAFCRSVLLRC